MAAQLMAVKPGLVRGGPWTEKVLSSGDKREISAAAQCKGVVELSELAEGLGSNSKLYQHLKDRVFAPRSGTKLPQRSHRTVRILDVAIKVPPLNVGGKLRGRSGTPTSGAQSRFNKLPLPKGVRKLKKRPAASKK